MTRRAVRRALVSVHDKRGLVEFARRLTEAGVELVASGGTAAVLEEAGVSVRPVEEVTGTPSLLEGRVKTLHPRLHGAILADRGRPQHREELAAEGLVPFDLVVVGLYPFRDHPGVEAIDIGGPALLRAAAKNHAWVGAVSSPALDEVVAEAVEAGGLDDGLRRRLAREAFFRSAAHDAAVVDWLEDGEAVRLVLPLRQVRTLRYGENPHQTAAAYLEEGGSAWWADARQLQGKELSYTNLLDAGAAWSLAWDLEGTAAVIVKHANPCGAASRVDPVEAWRAAWEGDRRAAFGGVVALNHRLEGPAAREMAERFLEVVVAPEVDDEAAQVLAARPALRLLEAPAPSLPARQVRSTGGGLLVQEPDRVGDDGWQVVVGSPSAEELDDLRLAWVVAAHAASNAVVISRQRAVVGVGAGDQSRVGAAERAVAGAGERARGAVAAGDAFFPFRDGIDILAEAGVTAVVAPGGSRRDEEVIAAARERSLALVFAGRRHFRH